MLSRLRRLIRRPVTPPAPAPQWVTVKGGPLIGHSIFVDTQVSAWQEMVEGRFEPEIYESLGDLRLLEGATVWDVGAHFGYHTLAFASLVGPSGRVIAFEPNPDNVQRLQMNLDRNADLAKSVTVVQQALSNADGETALRFSDEVDSGRSSGSYILGALVPQKPRSYRTYGETTVATTRGDSLVNGGGIPTPQVIKMDIEGAEHIALEGCQELLSSARPTLLVEVHHVVAMFHIQKLLWRAGYDIQLVGEDQSLASRCFIAARPAT